MQIDTIDPQKTAMIVVDMQNDFVAAGAGVGFASGVETASPNAVVQIRKGRESGL